jgi:hypothetical protein
MMLFDGDSGLPKMAQVAAYLILQVVFPQILSETRKTLWVAGTLLLYCFFTAWGIRCSGAEVLADDVRTGITAGVFVGSPLDLHPICDAAPPCPRRGVLARGG